MEITQTTLFTFVAAPFGQAFNFGIPATSRQAAVEDLRKKLLAIVGELDAELNALKAKSGN